MSLKNKIKISDSLKNVTKISSGTLLGQIISFIAVPIYTRMYGASILGIAAVINSVSVIITSFSDLGLKNAIMIEDEDKTEQLYTMISTLTAIVALVTTVVSFFYYKYIDVTLEINAFWMAVIMGISVFVTPQTQTCYTWLNKKGQYDVLMKNPIVHNLSMAIISIVLGLLGFKKYGYFIGLVGGSIITIVRMKLYLPKVMFDFNLNDYKYMLKTKKEFYLYQMPTNVLGQFKEQVPVFAIKMFFGVEMLGYYSITTRYLNLPINLLAQSIGRIFFKEVADLARNKKPVGEYAIRNVKRAMMFASIPLIAIVSIGDLACVIMFGKDYIVAGNIMRIIALNSFLMFIMISCNGLTIVLHQQKANMIASILQMVGYMLGISAGYFLANNIYISCGIMTIIYVLVQGVFFGYLFEKSGAGWQRYALNMLKSFGMIAGCSVIVRAILLTFGIVVHW